MTLKIDPIVRAKIIIYMLRSMNVDLSAIVSLLETEYPDLIFTWGGDERKNPKYCVVVGEYEKIWEGN